MANTNINLNLTAPDGRQRIIISVPLHYTLRQVISLACEKFNFSDSATTRYGLRHAGPRISSSQLSDLALSVRLAGLLPGSKLELIEIISSKCNDTTLTAKKVSIGLQVILNGQHFSRRFTREFPSTCSLWKILCILHQKEKNGFPLFEFAQGKVKKVPSLVILNQEYFGIEKLIKTSLAEIGIIKGSCLIRMSLKEIMGDSLITTNEAMEMIQREVVEEEKTILTTDCPNNDDINPIGTHELTFSENSKASSDIFSTKQPINELPNYIFFAPPSPNDSHINSEFPPDSFYEMNELEGRLYYSSLQSNTRSLTEAPLVSRAKLIEKKRNEILTKYPKTRIRFRFVTDQYCLEINFDTASTTINILYQTLQEFLKEEIVIQQLSVGPPPKILSKEKDGKKNLLELDLTPAAIVNVKINRTGDERLSTLEAIREEVAATMQQSSEKSDEKKNMSLPIIDIEKNRSMHNGSQVLVRESLETLNSNETDSAFKNIQNTISKKKPAWFRL